MRFIYADPGLSQSFGHHAQWCRDITRQVKERGIPLHVLAFKDIEDPLKSELGAIPFFEAFTYSTTDGDPISGWLNMFHEASQTTARDLARLGDITSSDLLYLSAGQPAQLNGLILWLASLPASQVPHVIFEFGTEPGLDVKKRDGQSVAVARAPKIDARAILYRFVGSQMAQQDLSRLTLVSSNQQAAMAFAFLLKRPVETIPLPRPAAGLVRSRVEKRPITISVLGHQRWEKGYHYVPDVVRQLIDTGRDIRFLVHNSFPESMQETHDELRGIALTESRLMIKEGAVDEQAWGDLLNESDLLLCPYEPQYYAFRVSGIGSEAFANAIPLVTSSDTAVAWQMEEFGCGIAFEEMHPSSIVDATLRLLDRYDEFAERAYRTAENWSETHGERRFVDSLFAFCRA